MQPVIAQPVSDVDSVLSTFASHGLSDLNNSSLMNRVDSKFVVNREHLALILERCRDHYSVLEIDDLRTFKYHSCYYDTDQLDFFQRHQRGKLNRIKLRHRRYVDTDSSFFELKFKNNKGRTLKSRISTCNDPLEALTQAQSFLSDKRVSEASDLRVVQSGEYKRISLANEEIGERLTIDCDLSFLNMKTWQSKSLNNIVIFELKQHRHNRRSPFYQLMREMSIRPQSFSKYCMGMTLTSEEDLRANRFKKNLLTLNKIEQQRVY